MVLSLGGGRLVEYAPPCVLLGLRPYEAGHVQADGPGLFRSLVSETGPETSGRLIRMAVNSDAAMRAAK